MKAMLANVVLAAAMSAAAQGTNSIPDAVREPVLHGLGYRITNCVYDVFGLDVSFATTNEPPYLVGVFVAEEACFMSRLMPLRAKIVREKHASLSGDFVSRGTTFVQVFDASVTNDPLYRVMENSAEYFSNMRRRFSYADGAVTTNYVDSWSERYFEENMRPVADWTWGSFKVTSDTSFTVRAAGKKAVPDLPVECPDGFILVRDNGCLFYGGQTPYAVPESYEKRIGEHGMWLHGGWEGRHFGNSVIIRVWNDQQKWYEDRRAFVAYNPHYPNEIGNFEYKLVDTETTEQTLSGFDTSVGCGCRILLDTRTQTFTAERAWSLFGDRSQEVVLRRILKPISAHDGKKVVVDAFGIPHFTSDTNAVPDRIHWEGL